MTAFNAEKFLLDYHLPTYSDGSKNVPAGCVGTRCPFCGDKSNHLHFRIGTWFVKCWRCGKHKVTETVAAILNIPKRDAATIVDQYVSKEVNSVIPVYQERIVPSKIRLPSGCARMEKPHKDYLISRGYDPDELLRHWGLMGTNYLDPDYRFRIVIPVFLNNTMVTFTSRDITGKQELKYRATSPDNEIVPIKNTLYGIDKARDTSIVVVEGPADVWRLGPGSVCVYGVQFTPAQAATLFLYQRVFILFDNDEAGKAGAESLYHVLNPMVEEVVVLQLGQKDPGSLSESEAKYIMDKYLKIRRQ